MTAGDDYRTKAAELRALARREKDPDLRAELEGLAAGYTRLAMQADLNSQADIAYETPRTDGEPELKP